MDTGGWSKLEHLHLSRLASSRKRSASLEVEQETVEDEWEEYEYKVELRHSTSAIIALKHPTLSTTPLTFCEYAAEGRLPKLNSTVLKEILDHHEIPYLSSQRIETRFHCKYRGNDQRMRMRRLTPRPVSELSG